MQSQSSPHSLNEFTNNLCWKTDPLGEYRWTNIEGPLSQLTDALWIFGERGREVSAQILVPHWKLCLAVVRRWNTVSGQLDDVKLSLLGPINTPRRNESGSGLEIIAVRLHPEAAAAVLDVKPIDVVDHDPAFEHWPSLDAVRQVAESGAAADAVGAELINYLLGRLSPNRDQITFSALAARTMRRSFGLRRIKAVAAEMDVSERTFRRRFEQEVGLPPKQYARRVRLVNMLLQTDRIAAPNWSAVAHDFGYFDQAHMIDDTRNLTGVALSTLHVMRRGGF